MNGQYWSWLLSFVGVAGFILAGKKIWWAWYINIACQVLWFTYAIVTQQWGFLVGAFFYSAVFIRNAYLWTKEHREKDLIVSAVISAENIVSGTIKASSIKDYTEDVGVRSACFRFHGDEPCRPGYNHPAKGIES